MCAAPCTAVVEAAQDAPLADPADSAEQPLQWHPSLSLSSSQRAKSQRNPRYLRLLAYHGGRLLGYSSAGAVAALGRQSVPRVAQQTMARRPA